MAVLIRSDSLRKAGCTMEDRTLQMRKNLDNEPTRRLEIVTVILGWWFVFGSSPSFGAETVAVWLFDEQQGIYPSCVLGDAASGEYPLVIGPGGRLVAGKFGNALEACKPPTMTLPPGELLEALAATKQADGKNPPGDRLTWVNARFCGLMTRGERHLRQEVMFGSPTRSGLNLADEDWTVEFWYAPTNTSTSEGVVLEIGEGPRGANDHVTQLLLVPGEPGEGMQFLLVNQPSGTRLAIPSKAVSGGAAHYAFVYDAAAGQLRHYVDGQLQPLPKTCQLKPLAAGEEDYLCVGRDGKWERPLPGWLDELRVSKGQLYTAAFEPPASFSKYHHGYEPPPLKQGLAPLFSDGSTHEKVVPLAGRKHVFIDDAITADSKDVTLVVNPPRPAELVLENVGFSNHVTVFEDLEAGDGLIRLYFKGPKDSLAVWTSKDGVHFESPDLGREFEGQRNIVIQDPVGLGTIFVDPNAPPEERIKYFSGYRGRGQYVYSSPDGYRFTRNETSALPMRGASQSIVYYDEQRQKYVGYHRSDMYDTVGGHTERCSVMSETTDLMRPWPFRPVSQAEQAERSKTARVDKRNPWYLDNGPVTPPGFGLEFPRVVAPSDELDPPGIDVYVPKCIKYAWAPDTYLAFPLFYYHYHGEGPRTRRELGRKARKTGSGPLETQVATSRDGIHWRRFPRPTYIGMGRHGGLDIHRTYTAHGMVLRGEEIWQYYVGCESYHSPWEKGGREAIFRVVQRVDGFTSADFDYGGGELTTRPLVFEGNRLVLNLDTDATGIMQVGLLDEQGQPIPGFALDDCVYLNCDAVAAEVEWLGKGKDVSELAGRTVQVAFRGNGTKLYSLQFVKSGGD